MQLTEVIVDNTCHICVFQQSCQILTQKIKVKANLSSLIKLPLKRTKPFKVKIASQHLVPA
jgi:hypothetical protein